MTRIVILNAPPKAGKDTLADYAVKHVTDLAKEKFAWPMKQAMKTFFNLSDMEFDYYESNHTAKSTPSERFGGKSWREVNIEFSERFAKKLYDKSIFGTLLSHRIEDSGIDFIVSDGGFKEEVDALTQRFHKDNVMIIQVIRPGCDFSGDSRNYLTEDDVECTIHRYVNDESLDDFLIGATDCIKKFLNSD